MIIGNSKTEGPMIQCEACHTVYSQKKYDSCPYCWLKNRNDLSPKKRRPGRPKKREGWISI